MGCSVSTIANMLHSPDAGSQAEPMINRHSFLFSRTIGEGGFGRVSAEIFLGDEKWYALKEIKKTGLLKHKTGLSMLFGELNALQRADHTFLVKLHYAFHDARSCYLAFDLKTGGDLRFFLRHKKAFDERTLSFYVGCLTSALNYLHRRRIMHRDVKPENIILDQQGWPHLTDFGVAYVEPREHPAGLPLSCSLASGTKQYLAPEVFTKGHVHGPESDFWALGIVLFELMFFRRPFEKHVPVAYINYLELCHQQQSSAMGSSRCNSLTSTATSPNKSRRVGQTNEHCNAASTAVVTGMHSLNTAFSPAPSPSHHSSSSRASSRFSPMRHNSKAPTPSPTATYHRASPGQAEYDCPMPPQSVVGGSFRSCSASRGGVYSHNSPQKQPQQQQKLGLPRGVEHDDHELVLIQDRFAKVDVSTRGVSPSDAPTKLQGISPCCPAPCSPGAQAHGPSNTSSKASPSPTPTPFSPSGGCSINESVVTAFNRASGSVVSPSARRGLLAPLGSPSSRSPSASAQGSPVPGAFPENVGSPSIVAGIAQGQERERRDSNFTEAKDLFDCNYNGAADNRPVEGIEAEADEPSATAFLQLPNQLRVAIPMYNALLTKVSLQCVNMLEGLLDLRPECRLGAGKDGQVKNMRNHEWFSLFDWNVNKLEHRALGGIGGGGASAPDPTCDNCTPFNPHYWRKNLTYRVEDNFGGPVLSAAKPTLKEQEEAEQDAKLKTSSRGHHSSLSAETQSLFEGFYYQANHSDSVSTAANTGGLNFIGKSKDTAPTLHQAHMLPVC